MLGNYMEKENVYYATGKRKTSIARTWLRPGNGEISVNGRHVDEYFKVGSAKAFLMMPILLPLADLVGVTRQITVTAYCFGDGFSNMVYPTNPVLLIALGLTVVSYPKWLRWTLPLWGVIVVITLIFLAIGVLIGYGPF